MLYSFWTSSFCELWTMPWVYIQQVYLRVVFFKPSQNSSDQVLVYEADFLMWKLCRKTFVFFSFSLVCSIKVVLVFDCVEFNISLCFFSRGDASQRTDV